MFNFSELEQVAQRYDERLQKAAQEHRARYLSAMNNGKKPTVRQRAIRSLSWTLQLLGLHIGG
jgi:hypothetical protein